MVYRIYDAAFAPGTPMNHHEHLGTFWWVDGNGSLGTWTRTQAVDQVMALPKGSVYVSENGSKVTVWVYHYKANPGVEWIQTEADGKKGNNLVTLAEHHEARA